MKFNKIVFIFLTFNFIFGISNAQNNRIKLKGLVKYDSIKLKDINIKNITSNFGTTSDKNGEFNIYAKKGESILFSSIVYQNRIIKISETHINSKTITVYLEPDIYQLDEVMLNKSFKLDVSNAPVTPGTVLDYDEVSSRKPPNSENIADPNASFRGANPIAILFMAYNAITKKSRLRRKKRKREEQKIRKLKQNFPTTIRNLYDDEFYVKGLSIPKDKINLFLDYCQENGLEDYYNKDEIIIKNFLVKQSIKFNAIKN